jgi:hypothetical protein
MSAQQLKSAGSTLCDVFPDVSCENFVDERLIAHASALGLFAEPFEDFRVETNGDQLPRLVSDGGTPHPAHGLQLLRRGIRDIREINSS